MSIRLFPNSITLRVRLESSDDDPVKITRFNSEIDTLIGRWGAQLAKDLYYSPKLILGGEDLDTSKNGVLGEYRGEFYSRLSGQAS